MKTPAALALIIATSPILIPSARAVLGVGDLVSDPVVEYNTTQKNIFDNIKYAWEQTQWADKLATLHDTLFTVRENLQTLILVRTALGDPSQIPAILDELALNGALSESGIFDTLSEIGGIVREGSAIAMQLEYLSKPVDLNGYRNAARAGTLYSFMREADSMAKYRAVEDAYLRYNGALQVGEGRARNMRMQLARLNTRVGSSSTDAETQKVAASIATADAALSDVEVNMQHSAEQVQVAHTMAVNREAQEKEAIAVSLQELNNETEANLSLPVDDIADVTVNF